MDNSIAGNAPRVYRAQCDSFPAAGFTADVGVIGAGAATEQLIVTGGDGVYQNAKGTIYSFNNVLGQWGPFQGKLCFGS